MPNQNNNQNKWEDIIKKLDDKFFFDAPEAIDEWSKKDILKTLHNRDKYLLQAQKEEMVERVKDKLDKFTRYGTTEHSGNVWAYKCEDIDGLLDNLINTKDE